jgi:hypothetical protein
VARPYHYAADTHRVFSRSALDEATAKHARLAARRVIEHTGLAGRHALFAADQFDFVAAIDRAQPGRLRRPRGANLDEDLQPVTNRAVERSAADPVDVAQHDTVHAQRLARSDHDAGR